MMSSSRHSGSRNVATRSGSQDEEPSSPVRSSRVRVRRPHASDHFDSEEEKKDAMLIDAPEAHSNGAPVSTNRRRGRKRRQASSIPQASDAGNEEHANDATAIDVDLTNQDNQNDSKYDVPLSLVSDMHDYNHSSASAASTPESVSITPEQYQLFMQLMENDRRHQINQEYQAVNQPSSYMSLQEKYAKVALKILAPSSFPRWLPPTPSSPSVIPYLESIERVMVNSEDLLPRDQWYRIVIADEVKVTAEFKRRLYDEITSKKLPWEQLKKEMARIFNHGDYDRFLRHEFFKFRQGNLSILEYNVKFNSYMEKLSCSDADKTNIQLYLDGLDPSLHIAYETSRMSWIAMNGSSADDYNSSVKVVMDRCERLAQQQNNIKKITSNEKSDSSRITDATNHSKNERFAGRANPLQSFQKKDKYCKNHGWCKHSTNECRSTTPVVHPTPMKREPTVSCYICKGSHYANQCPNRNVNGEMSMQWQGKSNNAIVIPSKQSSASVAPSSLTTSNNPWTARDRPDKIAVRQARIVLQQDRAARRANKAASSHH